jgi:hypothetical protein
MPNIETNRRMSNYTVRERLARLFWSVGRTVFRLTPRPCFGCRRALLRLFGAKVGSHVNIYPSALIYYPWNFNIGDWSSIQFVLKRGFLDGEAGFRFALLKFRYFQDIRSKIYSSSASKRITKNTSIASRGTGQERAQRFRRAKKRMKQLSAASDF